MYLLTRFPLFSREIGYTKHRDTSAASECILDIIAHGGRTAKSGSWVKKKKKKKKKKKTKLEEENED
jgi:hypothetical protein